MIAAAVAAAAAAEDGEGWEMGDKKVKNTLPLYGNKDSMNLNSMVLTNIVGSPYFKEDLYELKTFHEVVDEIYYRVSGGGSARDRRLHLRASLQVGHVEPWEKNSRKLAGQVGMCGGVSLPASRAGLLLCMCVCVCV